jgi:hypothetical protein
MAKVFNNPHPNFVLERGKRENRKHAERALRTLSVYERELDENPGIIQERLLDLLVDCCHLVQGSSAHLNLKELIEQAEEIFKAETEQASQAGNRFHPIPEGSSFEESSTDTQGGQNLSL